jgi:peptidoglycan/LPS O-acetylase OafA/YrhL
MLFYVVFALALAFSDGAAKRRFALITCMLLAIILVARSLAPAVDVMNFYANPVMLEFLLGMMLAVVWSSDQIRRSYGFISLIVAGFGVLWIANHMRVPFATNYLGALLVVAGTVFLPPLRVNPLSRLGDASYSLYLTHTVVLAAITWLCERTAIRPAPALFIISGLVCAFAVAFALYNYLELPATKALKHQFSARAPPKLAA